MQGGAGTGPSPGHSLGSALLLIFLLIVLDVIVAIPAVGAEDRTGATVAPRAINKGGTGREGEGGVGATGRCPHPRCAADRAADSPLPKPHRHTAITATHTCTSNTNESSRFICPVGGVSPSPRGTAGVGLSSLDPPSRPLPASADAEDGGAACFLRVARCFAASRRRAVDSAPESGRLLL